MLRGVWPKCSRRLCSTSSLTPKITLPLASALSKSKFTSTLKEGEHRVSPPLSVPDSISLPSYARRTGGIPDQLTDCFYGEIKTAEAIERMRKSGRVASQALQLALDSTRPGVFQLSLDLDVFDI